MKCPFCNHVFKKVIADYIEVLDGDCPSSCDDEVLLAVSCPSCGRKAWAKTIEQSYVTWHSKEFPDWVTVSDCKNPLNPRPVESTDEFHLKFEGGKVFLYSGNQKVVELTS